MLIRPGYLLGDAPVFYMKKRKSGGHSKKLRLNGPKYQGLSPICRRNNLCGIYAQYKELLPGDQKTTFQNRFQNNSTLLINTGKNKIINMCK